MAMSGSRGPDEGPRAYLERCGAQQIEVVEEAGGWKLTAEVPAIDGGRLWAVKPTAEAALERGAEQLTVLLDARRSGEI